MKFIHTAALFVTMLGLSLCGISTQAQVPGSSVNVKHYRFALTLNDADNSIKGSAAITVQFVKPATAFELNLVKRNAAGKGMLVSSVTEAGQPVKFVQDSDAVRIEQPAGAGQHVYTINYSGVPADGLIISTNKFGHRTFFGDNWPNRAHNWLPCVDDLADKASVEFAVIAPAHYQVIANGLKTEERLLPGQLKLTRYEEKADLPTDVMVIGVAGFAIQQSGKPGGIPVYTYVFPENKTTGFRSYAAAAQILPFYIQQFGPYAYQKLANVQSKTIFGGMENAGAIFYFEESVGDKGIEELMAHEIAHQWFGDAATESSWQHLWLSEGFATYMTNYYLERKYGQDTLQKRLAQQRTKVLNFERRRLTPVIDTAVHHNYMQLLNANSYEKGAWVLHMLRRKLGEAAFWQGIRNYYARYKGRNAATGDLKQVMEQAGRQNLTAFFKQWLYTAGAPDLDITWKYDEGAGAVNITVQQKQNTAFEFPLQAAIGNKVYTIAVKDKTTTLQLPVAEKPLQIKFDPDVNLLAKFNVVIL